LYLAKFIILDNFLSTQSAFVFIFKLVIKLSFMVEINLDKNHLFEITNELYRITLLFPKREPLRYKMRELADNF